MQEGSAWSSPHATPLPPHKGQIISWAEPRAGKMRSMTSESDEHRHDDRDDGRQETAIERADRNWEELLQELRVMQTGTQILTGFLLAVAFQPRFTELDAAQVSLYVILVLLAALATILALAPVGLHRALFGKQLKPVLVRHAALIVRIDLLVIGALSVGVTTLIVDFTVHRTAALITLVMSSLLVLILWLVVPMMIRRRRAHDSGS